MTSGSMEGDSFRAGSRIPAGAVSGEGDAPAGDWRSWALCREVDPELWFPEKGVSAKPAKRICADCPVAQECLQFAIANDLRGGVWGGLAERERRGMYVRKSKKGKRFQVVRPATEAQQAARRENIKIAHAKRMAS